MYVTDLPPIELLRSYLEFGMSNLSLVLKQGIWTNVSQFRRICLWFCCSCLRGTFNLLVHLMSSHELLHNRDQIPLRGNAEDIYLTSPLSSSAFVVASHHSCLTAIFIALESLTCLFSSRQTTYIGQPVSYMYHWIASPPGEHRMASRQNWNPRIYSWHGSTDCTNGRCLT